MQAFWATFFVNNWVVLLDFFNIWNAQISFKGKDITIYMTYALSFEYHSKVMEKVGFETLQNMIMGTWGWQLPILYQRFFISKF